MYSVDELEDRLIDLAFAEDIGDGDHTTLCCIPEDAMGKSHLLIKEDGILAGVEVAKRVFARFDPTMKVEVLMGDGTPSASPHAIAHRQPSVRSLRVSAINTIPPCSLRAISAREEADPFLFRRVLVYLS